MPRFGPRMVVTARSPSEDHDVVQHATVHGALKDTGFYPSVLQHLFDKYSGCDLSHGLCAASQRCRCAQRGTFRGQLTQPRFFRDTALYFFCYFYWFHGDIEVDRRGAWTDLQRGSFAGICSTTFYDRVLPIGAALAEIIEEIDYDQRLSPFNHAPFFKYHATAIVDTAPLFVSEPASFGLSKLTHQPKYKRNCFKLQVGCDFLGNPILITGPHLGVTADITIWESTWHEHPFEDWEVWLGDLGYYGAIGLLTKYKNGGAG